MANLVATDSFYFGKTVTFKETDVTFSEVGIAEVSDDLQGYMVDSFNGAFEVYRGKEQSESDNLAATPKIRGEKNR